MKYRIENSRTNIQQLTYLRNNPNSPNDLFSDPEAEKAQIAQGQILTEMVEGKSEFLEDLKDRSQVEAAIITHDGFIVNGNRRTAALKLLGEDYLDCVVLPEDTTKQDIYDLEQELQIAKEFKEPYHWINELKNIQLGLTQLGLTTSHIAKRLHQKENDVKSKSRMLDLIDSFLIWKNIPDQHDYEKLDETEQIFADLEKTLRNQHYRQDPSKQEDLKKAVFALIENKPTEGRLYQHVRDLVKGFDQIREKFSDVSSEKTDAVDDDNDPKNQPDTPVEDDPQEDILAEFDDKGDTSNVKISGFDTPEDASTNVDDLVEVIGDVKASEKEKDDDESVYNSVSKALRELQGLKASKTSTKLKAAKNKLKEIKVKADELLKQIDKRL
ncbi:hypothetical protein ACFL45_03115 [Candidatus Neomarinimicrobiota bacterium]